jgi:hypothetical protein
MYISILKTSKKLMWWITSTRGGHDDHIMTQVSLKVEITQGWVPLVHF